MVDDQGFVYFAVALAFIALICLYVATTRKL